MTHSDSIGELAAALTKAQAALEIAKRESANPFFKSKYADLGEVWRVVKAAFNPHGLSVTQFPGMAADGSLTLTTVLLHTSGEFMSDTMPVLLGTKTLKHRDGTEELIPATDPQSQGSALTYARRYSLAAVCGVVSDEDDDAEAAMGRNAAQAAPAAPQVRQAKPRAGAQTPELKATDAKVARIVAVQKELADTYKFPASDVLATTASLREAVTDGRAKTLADLTDDEAALVVEGLQAWAADQSKALQTPTTGGDNDDPFGSE